MWVMSQDRRYIAAAKVFRLDGPIFETRGIASYRIIAIPEAGIEITVARFTDKEAAVKEFEALAESAAAIFFEALPPTRRNE